MTQPTTTSTRKPAAKKAPARPAPKKAAAVPPGAKQPADRKPPAGLDDPNFRTATVDGHEYRANVDALDDFEVVEALQVGNYVPAIGMLLDEEQLAKVKDRLRDKESGRVRYSDVVVFTNKLLEALRPNS